MKKTWNNPEMNNLSLNETKQDELALHHKCPKCGAHVFHIPSDKTIKCVCGYVFDHTPHVS